MVRDRLAGACLTIAGLGYAIPGTVLALGLLSPLVGIDNGLNWLIRAACRRRIVGLVVAGSSAALDHRLCDPLSRHRDRLGAGRPRAHLAPEIDDVARTLGTKPCGHRLAHPSAADAARARRARPCSCSSIA